MKINLKKLRDTATIPTRGSVDAAGYDLYSDSSYIIEINPGQTVMIGTGIAMEIPEGYFGAVYARSGLAAKMGLRPANCVGVIDSDYRGEIIVALYNDSSEVQKVSYGDRIAQLVIMPYLSVDFSEVESLDNTERGSGGYGSTGVSM